MMILTNLTNEEMPREKAKALRIMGVPADL